jgi:hypothetical protein
MSSTLSYSLRSAGSANHILLLDGLNQSRLHWAGGYVIGFTRLADVITFHRTHKSTCCAYSPVGPNLTFHRRLEYSYSSLAGQVTATELIAYHYAGWATVIIVYFWAGASIGIIANHSAGAAIGIIAIHSAIGIIANYWTGAAKGIFPFHRAGTATGIIANH